MNKMIVKAFDQIPSQWKSIKMSSKHKPEDITPKSAGELLKGKKRVLIITGAGISAASNIPTFRGDDGIWTKKYKHCKSPQELATWEFFIKHPDVKWQWTYDFLELVRNNHPNAGH
jgi:NAD-dependent deacetylase